jgi:hypothetical protein
LKLIGAVRAVTDLLVEKSDDTESSASEATCTGVQKSSDVHVSIGMKWQGARKNSEVLCKIV